MTIEQPMTTITLRSGTGAKKGSVEIVGKVRIELRSTHNRDGKFVYVIALGVNGAMYETKSRGGGYRFARDQKATRGRYDSAHLQQVWDFGLSSTMQHALRHMLHVEEETKRHNGACSNIEIGHIVKSNTATALEKRGLAKLVRCRIDHRDIELRLTDAGRAIAGGDQ